MLMQIVKPDFEFFDERGKIIQLIHKGFSQVNVITSHPGASRGRHYHKQNCEVFYFSYGKCRVIAETKDGEQEERIFSAGDMFMIDPYIMHSFEYLEETMVISMYSRGVELDNGEMDSYDNF